MSKTGNSYFTFCNLTDKRRKCVFIKLAVSTQFIGRSLREIRKSLWKKEIVI